MVVIGNDLLSIRQQNQEAGMIVWSHTFKLENWNKNRSETQEINQIDLINHVTISIKTQIKKINKYISY